MIALPFQPGKQVKRRVSLGVLPAAPLEIVAK